MRSEIVEIMQMVKLKKILLDRFVKDPIIRHIHQDQVNGRESEASLEIAGISEDCVFVDKQSDSLMVQFSGIDGGFNLLNKFRNIRGSILAIRDPTNSWYQNCAMPLNLLGPAIGKWVNHRGFEKILVVGDSAGAYAALYAAPYIKRSVCLAFSPQTFQVNEKTNIEICCANQIERTLGTIFDLRGHLTKKSDGAKFVITGFSETKNAGPYFWGDHFQAANLINVQNVEILICNQNHHPVLWYFDPQPTFQYIFENFDDCLANTREAAKRIASGMVFF